MKQLVNQVLHRWGYQVVNLSNRQRDLFADAAFTQIFDQAESSTTTPAEGIFAIYSIVRFLAANGVPGGIVDCAAWKCGGTIAMIETLRLAGETNRDVYAFDLFDEPDLNGKRYWNAADFAAVKARVYDRNYPPERIHLIAGDMISNIPAKAPSQIAFLRTDAGRAEVTSHLLRELYPRVVQGGYVFVNDYGSYLDASGRVTEEFLAGLHPRPLVHRVDHFGRCWRKL
jgi:hypothetical protein